MVRLFSIACLVLCAAIPTLFRHPQEGESLKQEAPITLPANDGNQVARRDFMRTKLLFSQNIFEGLTTGDMQMVKTGIREVHGITEGETWVTIDNPQYKKLTEDFKTAIKRLSEAAESGNFDATAMRYYNMATSCIDCHKHIRKANYSF